MNIVCRNLYIGVGTSTFAHAKERTIVEVKSAVLPSSRRLTGGRGVIATLIFNFGTR
jgi:hypothetical protein